jgi:hypothetical protein
MAPYSAPQQFPGLRKQAAILKSFLLAVVSELGSFSECEADEGNTDRLLRVPNLLFRSSYSFVSESLALATEKPLVKSPLVAIIR